MFGNYQIIVCLTIGAVIQSTTTNNQNSAPICFTNFTWVSIITCNTIENIGDFIDGHTVIKSKLIKCAAFIV